MQKIIISLALSLLITSCASNQHRASSGSQKLDPILNSAKRAHWEGISALNGYTNERVCDTTNAKDIKLRITRIESSRVEFDEFTALMRNSSATHTLQRQYRYWHTDLSFGFADKALKKGCLDDADKAYRNLINIYTGMAYGGIRDRAKLGIQDVRDARGK